MDIYKMFASASIWAEKNPLWANAIKYAATGSMVGGTVGVITSPPGQKAGGFMAGAFAGGGIGAGIVAARHYIPQALEKLAANRNVGGIVAG